MTKEITETEMSSLEDSASRNSGFHWSPRVLRLVAEVRRLRMVEDGIEEMRMHIVNLVNRAGAVSQEAVHHRCHYGVRVMQGGVLLRLEAAANSAVEFIGKFGKSTVEATELIQESSDLRSIVGAEDVALRGILKRMGVEELDIREMLEIAANATGGDLYDESSRWIACEGGEVMTKDGRSVATSVGADTRYLAMFEPYTVIAMLRRIAVLESRASSNGDVELLADGGCES